MAKANNAYNTGQNNVQQNNKPNPYRPNFWGMISQVIIASINKGQLLLMAFFVILLVLLIKMPSSEMPMLAKHIFNTFESWHILGWVFASLEAIAWYFTSKMSRKSQVLEMNSVSEEKSILQKAALGKDLKSTKKH